MCAAASPALLRNQAWPERCCTRHGDICHDRVEAQSTEIAGDGFVIADTTNPGVGCGRRGRGAQNPHERRLVANVRGPAPDRPLGRRQSEEMNVVVVEAWQQGAAVSVDVDVTPSGGGSGGDDAGDATAVDQDVDQFTTELGPTDGEPLTHPVAQRC